MEPTNKLDLWVVYEKPTDYPDKYVVRRFVNDIPTEEVFTADSLEEIRKFVPEYMVNIGTFPNDDPKIKEVWI